MFDPQLPLLEKQSTYVATMQVEVTAESQMEAAQKLRLMVVSSATPVRGWTISEFTRQE
jgi:hypothetical protein